MMFAHDLSNAKLIQELQQRHRTEPLPVQKKPRKHSETDHFDAFEL